MTCGSCVGMVETALSSVKGVVVARVSLRKHAAIVLVDTRLRYQPPPPPPPSVLPNTWA